MSTLKNIRRKIAAGIYELTHHAESEKEADDLTTQDVECAIRYGRIVMTYADDPRGPRYEISGPARDGRKTHVVCRVLSDGMLRVLTIWVVE